MPQPSRVNPCQAPKINSRALGEGLWPLGVPVSSPAGTSAAQHLEHNNNAADQSSSSSDNYSKIEALLQEERVLLLWFPFFALLFFLSFCPPPPLPFFLSFMSKLLFQGYRKNRLEAEILPLCPGVGFPGLDM